MVLAEAKVDKQLIASVLREMGIRPGDCIGLHSSVPSLGRVVLDAQKQGGNEAVQQVVHDVIDGFVEAVGPEQGLLMVPTFTLYYLHREEVVPFHPDKTRSKVGMLTELFWQRSDAVRSLHPTHSVAAIGGRAKELIEGHEEKSGLGVDTPFHRLAKWGGWICYLGTNSKTLSLLHVAEVLAQVPYYATACYEFYGSQLPMLLEREDGTIEEISLKEAPGCSNNFGKFDEIMARAGITRTGQIYKSKVTLFKAQDALELAIEKLKEDPFGLICPKGACPYCDVRWKAHGT